MAVPPTRTVGSVGHIGDHNDIGGELTSLRSATTAAAAAAAAAQATATAATAGGLVAANNLSDVPDPALARDNLGIVSSAVTLATLPAGVMVLVAKSGATWPARPTNRADLTVVWKGADPSPAIVSSGTGGMIDGVDIRFLL